MCYLSDTDLRIDSVRYGLAPSPLNVDRFAEDLSRVREEDEEGVVDGISACRSAEI